MGIFRGSGYAVMTAGAKKDQLQLTVPILTFLKHVSRKLRGNKHLGSHWIEGHLGFLNFTLPTLCTRRHKFRRTIQMRPKSRHAALNQYINSASVSGSGYYVVWLQVPSDLLAEDERQRNRATDREKENRE